MKVFSVSPIWSRGVIECIRTPLLQLLKLLEDLYPIVIKTDSSISNHMKVQTKQIELYASKNPEKNLIQQARLLEDTSLRGYIYVYIYYEYICI